MGWQLFYILVFFSRLPKNDLSVAGVDPKQLDLASGVSENDDLSVHTPRKTIAEVLESKQVIYICWHGK